MPTTCLVLTASRFGEQWFEGSRESVIRDLIAGQIEDATKVLEINEDGGTCRNVSEDVAREIAGRVQRDPISDDLISFIGLHCGVMLANEMRRAA